MNRRDYLKRMGAAGVLVGAAGLRGFAREDSAQRSCPSEAPCINPAPGAPQIWEPRWCDPFPRVERSEYVKLIFEGLTGFAPRPGQKTPFACDVGFHSKGDGPVGHHLQIVAYNNAVNADSCDEVYRTAVHEKIKTLALEVPQPKGVNQTFFYQPGRACSRQELTDDQDFRWMVDFESDYLHGKYLKKNKSIYRPILTVEYGIFYTLRKTASTFRAQTEDGNYVCHLGNVANIMGANVYVESRSHVRLIVDNKCYEVYAPGEIYFKNHCMKDDTEDYCDFNPYNLNDKKKRSDFFLNYKAFDRAGSPEFQLFIAERRDQTMTPEVVCEKDRLTPKERPTREDRLNDEAPCSGAGYGKGNTGLPPNSP